MEKVQPIKDKRKLNRMKKILRANNLRDYCLFVLGINSRSRVSDLVGLYLCDVLDENHAIRDRICTRNGVDLGKQAFPLNEAAKKALEEYLETRKPFVLDEPLFKSRKSRDGKAAAVQRDVVYKSIVAAAREAGITEPIGTNTMRKTWGYHAVINGGKVKYIQKLLRQSSEAATLDFLDFTQEELDNIILHLNL